MHNIWNKFLTRQPPNPVSRINTARADSTVQTHTILATVLAGSWTLQLLFDPNFQALLKATVSLVAKYSDGGWWGFQMGKVALSHTFFPFPYCQETPKGTTNEHSLGTFWVSDSSLPKCWTHPDRHLEVRRQLHLPHNSLCWKIQTNFECHNFKLETLVLQLKVCSAFWRIFTVLCIVEKQFSLDHFLVSTFLNKACPKD